MVKRKHAFLYSEYKDIVAAVEKVKTEKAVTVDEACKECGYARKFYNYARQMLRRGKPMCEIEGCATT